MDSQSRDLNGRAVLQNGTLPILPEKVSEGVLKKQLNTTNNMLFSILKPLFDL
jgi:hypothetical protein